MRCVPWPMAQLRASAAKSDSTSFMAKCAMAMAWHSAPHGPQTHTDRVAPCYEAGSARPRLSVTVCPLRDTALHHHLTRTGSRLVTKLEAPVLACRGSSARDTAPHHHLTRHIRPEPSRVVMCGGVGGLTPRLQAAALYCTAERVTQSKSNTISE